MKLQNDHLERAARIIVEAEQHLETSRIAAELCVHEIRTAIFELQRAQLQAKEK